MLAMYGPCISFPFSSFSKSKVPLFHILHIYVGDWCSPGIDESIRYWFREQSFEWHWIYLSIYNSEKNWVSICIRGFSPHFGKAECILNGLRVGELFIDTDIKERAAVVSSRSNFRSRLYVFRCMVFNETEIAFFTFLWCLYDFRF